MTIPRTFEPFALVNVSIAACTSDNECSTFAHVPAKACSTCEGLITTPYVSPAFLHAFYGLDAVDTSKHADGNLQSVAEFSGQFYSPNELTRFLDLYHVDATAKVTQNGPNDPSQVGIEATLDIQAILGVAPNVDTVVISAPKPYATHLFLWWAKEITNTTDAPLVSSLSFGGPETACNESPSYCDRLNVEFAKMCTRGLSVLAATGDGGSTSIGHPATECVLTPQIPASFPYVTAVSATFVDGNAPPRGTGAYPSYGEAIASMPLGVPFTTGGGFSSIFKQPVYQKAAVDAYLATDVPFPPAGTFNSSGRAFADVSALGHNVLNVLGEVDAYPEGGTSASAPIFAGIVSLINSERLAAGKPPVGFINPALYALHARGDGAFYDVTVGNNACGDSQCCPRKYGYTAAAGYDVVSGLGSVGNFSKMLDYFMRL